MNKYDIIMWQNMLSHVGEPMSVDDISDNTNFSRRQTVLRVNMMCNPHITREYSGERSIYTLSATPDELVEDTLVLLSRKFSMPVSEVRAIMNNISTVGYMTLEDISSNTDMNHFDMVMMLRTLPNVESIKIGKKTYFRRVR